MLRNALQEGVCLPLPVPDVAFLKPKPKPKPSQNSAGLLLLGGSRWRSGARVHINYSSNRRPHEKSSPCSQTYPCPLDRDPQAFQTLAAPQGFPWTWEGWFQARAAHPLRGRPELVVDRPRRPGPLPALGRGLGSEVMEQLYSAGCWYPGMISSLSQFNS